MTTRYWSQDLVFNLLRQKFPGPTYVLLPQVRNATGYRRRARWADALAVSVFPSRGVYCVGIEIKVTKPDWRKELADPQKAESIQKYCRHWYVAAPKGVVPVDEVPATWGLFECDARSITTTKEAPKLDEMPPDMLFVASVLRKMSEVTLTVDEAQRKVQKAVGDIATLRKEAAAAVALEHDLAAIKETVTRFEEASGVTLTTRWTAGRIGAAVKTVLHNNEESATVYAKRLVAMARNIIDQFGTDMPDSS